MMVAAFITAHAETAQEAELRCRLRSVRRELGQMDKLLGAVPDTYPDGHLSVVEE